MTPGANRPRTLRQLVEIPFAKKVRNELVIAGRAESPGNFKPTHLASSCGLISSCLPPMFLCVAESAQGNQVCHCIATEPAPTFQMVYLQILWGATFLTPPAISF